MAAKAAKKAPSKTKKDEAVEINLGDTSNFAVPAAILISAVIVAIAIIYTGSKDTTSTLSDTDTGAAETTEDTGETVAQAEAPAVLGELQTFSEHEGEICKEDGKPVVYLFSTTWCPHCEWISYTFDSWAKANSDKITAYHWELDTNDNTLTSDAETEVPSDHQDVYEKFNPNGSIPTFVFGCTYSRVGNGYESEDDLEKEKAAFDAVLQEII